MHIDAIKPVWRTDLKAEWFDQIDADIQEADASRGRRRTRRRAKGGSSSSSATTTTLIPRRGSRGSCGAKDPRRTDFGPYQFITDKVLTKLNDPELRLFGVDHVAVAWLDKDTEWTSEKGMQNNNLASNTVPLLDRAAPPAGARAAGGGARHGGSAWA